MRSWWNDLDAAGLLLTLLPFAMVLLGLLVHPMRRERDRRREASRRAPPPRKAPPDPRVPLLGRADVDEAAYRWTHASPDDPRILGKPDYSEVDRREGYEVLYLVNRYAAEHGLGREGALAALRGIRTAPGEHRTRIELERWLDANGYRLRP
jgi:hypothetical protein